MSWIITGSAVPSLRHIKRPLDGRCVLPSLEWVVAELCLPPAPSSSHSSLNTGQKCSGGGRGILSAVPLLRGAGRIPGWS